MLVHPQFDPIAFSLGPVAVRWYGLMYLVAFALLFLLGRARIRAGSPSVPPKFGQRDLEDLLFWGAIGTVLGGRLGYVLFYKPAHFLSHPLEIFMVWQGGMAFHGGLIGVIAAMALYARRRGWRFLQISDFVAPLVPLGLAAGRMGNFINGELWGRPTTVPWGMVFPQVGDGITRHPSQLYQFAGEGILLFLILWLYSSRPRAMGAISGLFLAGYGVMRFLAEFAREPDAFLGLLGLGLSMGQWLSLPMIALGLALMAFSRRAAPAEARK
ncbi:prolipoprotein diacylglyceryl transferase [Zeimonas arvi]|uniref:Phosphatidylglycerol--prolipoprotein diacylglyceryl transferase n=1 Tax=Zeimonas arvi TaxID=2498847 RepID=A0A5C8NYV6_9BURK|nr:prolipoprotein diacylglyceryl transferase [Zeimonas arvi]TXL66185.1 prolipoprotein diacylglyceryl transferase [Zeimonas arvi]